MGEQVLNQLSFSFCHCFCLDMRGDVQEIFRMTPHEKQVMMFSATLSKDIRPVCRKFMQDVSHCQENLMFSWNPLYFSVEVQ